MPGPLFWRWPLNPHLAAPGAAYRVRDAAFVRGVALGACDLAHANLASSSSAITSSRLYTSFTLTVGISLS